MINGAGHTIIISGGTLICCFLGMLIFPLAMLQSVGIGASVTLFFALSVNLTLTPAILYSFGHVIHPVTCLLLYIISLKLITTPHTYSNWCLLKIASSVVYVALLPQSNAPFLQDIQARRWAGTVTWRQA